MIGYSHAIVEPWAVVVESFDALVAGAAVSGPWCSDDLTVGAKLNGID